MEDPGATRAASGKRRSVYPQCRVNTHGFYAKLAEHLSDELLTPRELEVLASMASGACNKEIADVLRISEER